MIFLTHVHGDHSSSLPLMTCRWCPPTIFVPYQALETCQAYLESYLDFRLHGQDSKNGNKRSPTYYLRGVEAGSKVDLTTKPHKDKAVEVFQCIHSVICVGYGFLQKKKKLKHEYAEFSGKELGILRKQGVQIDQTIETPMFVFMGDTTVLFYEEQQELEREGKDSVFRYPLIITECTFLGIYEDDSFRAESTKHTLWNDLKPFIVSHPDITFVLIHFSHRYSQADIRTFFNNEGVGNVVPFVQDQLSCELQQEKNDLEQSEQFTFDEY